jgi:hypothetical protein
LVTIPKLEGSTLGALRQYPAMDIAAELARQTLLHGCCSVGKHLHESDGAIPWLGVALRGEMEPLSQGTPFAWSSEVCRSNAELTQALQGGMGLSGALAMLPIPLLKVQRTLMESLKTTSCSVSLVVQARRVLAAYGIPKAEWNSSAAVPTGSTELDAFVGEYGDSWVRAVEVGGSLQGVYTLYAQSQQQAKEVGERLDLLVAAGGVNLGPSFSRRLQEVASETKVNARFRVSIAGLANPPALNEDQIEEFARNFGSIVLDKPEILSFQSSGYEQLAALRDALTPVAENRKLLCGDGVSIGLLGERQKLLEIINQCTWINDTYEIYGLAADPSLAVNRSLVKADIEAIEALCSQYQASPSTPLQKPTLTALATGSPNLQVELSDGEVMGGGGGEPFRYLDRENAIRRRRRLAQVGLRSGGRIDEIRLHYQQEPAGATDEWIHESHGNDGGGRNKGEMELARGETIHRIRAKTGVPNGRVDRLTLNSSDGQELGGGGEAGNKELDWQPAANQVLLGFSGRSGSELDSLRAVIATFGPLHWEPVEAG